MPPQRDHPFLPNLRARLHAIRQHPSAILTALSRHLRLGPRDPATAERAQDPQGPYTRPAFGNADRAAEYEAAIARVLALRRGPVDLSRVQSWDFEGPSTEPSTESSTASSGTEEEEENGEEVVLAQEMLDSYVPRGAAPGERRDSYRGYHSTNSARMRRERLRMVAERMGGGETMSERSMPGFASSSSSSTSALENGAGPSSAAASPESSSSQASERHDPARQPNTHVPASLAHIFTPPPIHPATPGSSSGDSGVDVRPGRHNYSPPGPRVPATESPSPDIPQVLQRLPVRAAPSPPAPGKFKFKSKATAPRPSSSCPTPSSSDSEPGVQNPPGPAHPLRRKNRCSLRARFRLGTPEPLVTTPSAPPAPTTVQHAAPRDVQSATTPRDEARAAHASLAQRLRATRLEDLHGMTPGLHAEIAGLLSELRQSRESAFATLPRRSARGSARQQNTVDAAVRGHGDGTQERGDAAMTLPRGYRVPGGEGRRGREGVGMVEGEGRREEERERGRSRVRRGSEGVLGSRGEDASARTGVPASRPPPPSSPHIRFAPNLPVPIRTPSYRASARRRRPPSPYPGVYPGARRACAATSAGPPAPWSAHTNVPVPRRARANRTSRRRGRAPSPYPGARRGCGNGDGGEWEDVWGDEEDGEEGDDE